MIQRWDIAGAAALTRLRAELDVAYGDGLRERLDIYRPEPAGAPQPVLLFIHGGYWQWRDKKDFVFLAEPWVEAGAVVVLVNYPLAPAAAMDEIVDACRRAVAWTVARVCGQDGAARRLWVAGHSAGGHLTAEMLATDWRSYGFALPPVAGGLAISGLYELEPIRLSYLNAVLGMDEQAAHRNSPALHPRVTLHRSCVRSAEPRRPSSIASRRRWSRPGVPRACRSRRSTLLAGTTSPCWMRLPTRPMRCSVPCGCAWPRRPTGGRNDGRGRAVLGSLPMAAERP